MRPGCVLLFSLDRPYFPVDTHVHRVARRLALVPERSTAVAAQAALQDAVPPSEVYYGAGGAVAGRSGTAQRGLTTYELHMQLIRHGRHVCVARRPRCSECVLSDICPKVGVTERR